MRLRLLTRRAPSDYLPSDSRRTSWKALSSVIKAIKQGRIAPVDDHHPVDTQFFAVSPGCMKGTSTPGESRKPTLWRDVGELLESAKGAAPTSNPFIPRRKGCRPRVHFTFPRFTDTSGRSALFKGFPFCRNRSERLIPPQKVYFYLDIRRRLSEPNYDDGPAVVRRNQVRLNARGKVGAVHPKFGSVSLIVCQIQNRYLLTVSYNNT